MAHQYMSDNSAVLSAGLKVILSLVVLIGANTSLFAQSTADPPKAGTVVRMPAGPSYTVPVDIPGASREQQEMELLAQKKAGCSMNKLDRPVMDMLTPYFRGLVAQSNFATARLTPHVTVMRDPELMAIYRQADRMSRLLDNLYMDHSPEADRALVYLLRLHFLYSDFDDDSIDCELAKRADRVQTLLGEMGHCLPLTGLEPYPHQMVLPLTRLRQRIREIPDACSRHVGE